MTKNLHRPVFGVAPAAERHRLHELFGPLEAALDVRFSADLEEATAGLIELSDRARVEPGRTTELPRLVILRSDETPRAAIVPLRFTGDRTLIDSALAGRILEQRALPPIRTETGHLLGGSVVADVGSSPAWVRSGETEIVAGGARLDTNGPLLTRLFGDASLPLIALIQFVRRHHPDPWRAPPVRAAFLFDDPNLHSVRYGHLDFRDAAEAGHVHGFHTAIALIPLDARFASRRAVSLFRRSPDQLSLLIHGSNHLRREMGDTDQRRLGALAQSALARIASFEQRYDLTVDRVMAPPHGACSYEALDVLRRTGFEAMCVSRPYPWLTSPPPDRPLAGWGPTEIVADGLPILPRLSFSNSSESELALRAFLRQPLIVYGHHGDVAQGTAVLARMAEQVTAVGATEWCSTAAILRGLYDHRLDGDTIVLRPHARRIEARIPPGVTRARVVVDVRFEADGVSVGSSTAPDGEGAYPVTPESTVAVAIRQTSELVAGGRAPRVLPYVRRAGTEIRDRLQPTVLRVRGRQPS